MARHCEVRLTQASVAFASMLQFIQVDLAARIDTGTLGIKVRESALQARLAQP